MGRLCERPGCSQPAKAMYGIDADHLTVWIEPFDAEAGYRAGSLCRRHADAMVVPIGWLLDDRRDPEPRLFKAPEPPPVVKTPTRRPRQTGSDQTGQLELVVVDAPDEPGPSSDDTGSAWRPVFDQSDDLDGLLTADSPLLSRAFGKADQRRKH